MFEHNVRKRMATHPLGDFSQPSTVVSVQSEGKGTASVQAIRPDAMLSGACEGEKHWHGAAAGDRDDAHRRAERERRRLVIEKVTGLTSSCSRSLNGRHPLLDPPPQGGGGRPNSNAEGNALHHPSYGFQHSGSNPVKEVSAGASIERNIYMLGAGCVHAAALLSASASRIQSRKRFELTTVRSTRYLRSAAEALVALAFPRAVRSPT